LLHLFVGTLNFRFRNVPHEEKNGLTRSVTIIGAGPAGLTAARVLRAAGIGDVLVLERNPEAGGLPRFCGHIGWGVLDFHRMWTGPTYARRLVESAEGVDILTNHTVVAMHRDGSLEVNGPSGTTSIHSRAVLIATGIREQPRSARLISGPRPWGIVSTGAFQEMVYRGAMRPFQRPVVIGTELVAFSALLTARHAGIRPVAMIEPADRIIARRPGDLIARVLLGVPVRTRTRLVRIEGGDRVSGVVVEYEGRQETIACDGVILTGCFTPETGALRGGHLDIDPMTSGPSIDCEWRCSDPAYFAAGNLLRPIEHSGVAASEGALAAQAILRALDGRLPATTSGIAVRAGQGLRYVYPQRLVPGRESVRLFGRVTNRFSGRLSVMAGEHALIEKRVSVLPERRLTLDLPAAARNQPVDLRVELV
jgi:thioredoxin reductase